MKDTIPRGEHPRPDFERKDWVCLNGPWEFEMDPGNSGEARGLVTAKRFSKSIKVPFCMESPLSGIGHQDFVEAVWYRRKVSVPKAWRGRRILLHVGACDYETTVWVNGRRMADHRGGFSQITADITPGLTGSGTAEVVIRAVDTPHTKMQPGGKQSHHYHSHGCHYRRTTGIWQSVWLEAAGESWIERARITPDFESGRIFVQADLLGPACELQVRVFDGRACVAETTAPAAWRSSFAFLHIPEMRPWSISDPHLYEVELTLLRDGRMDDCIQSYTGFRKVHIEGNKFYLNYEPVFQRLVLDQGFYPDGILTAPTDRDLRRDIELSMAMGFNGTRLHQKVFEPRFLYWADRMGYLCWGEFPSWGIDANCAAAWENLTAEWVEVLQRDANHPCIIGWCPTNETPNEQRRSALAHLYRTTRAIDPTRPIIDASGYTHVVTDFDDNHDYTQNPKEFKARQDPLKEGKPFRNNPNDAPYQGQPFMCSEYGGIWWNPGQKDTESWGYGDRPKSEKEFIDRFRGLTEALLFNPAMAALCYTQLTDVEQEVNGLYTFRRKPKFDPKIINAILTQKAAIEG